MYLGQFPEDGLGDDLVQDGLGLLHGQQQGLAQVLVILQTPCLHRAHRTVLLDGVRGQSQPHTVVIVDLRAFNNGLVELWIEPTPAEPF